MAVRMVTRGSMRAREINITNEGENLLMKAPLDGMYCKIIEKQALMTRYPWCRTIEWQYINSGYREPCGLFKICFNSFFQIHNELVNIWTHFLGGFWCFCLLIWSITKLADLNDTIIFSIYCISSIFVCIFSTSYHAFHCHSENVCRYVQCLDWLVISTLIFSSNLLSSYYLLCFVNQTLFISFTIINVMVMIFTSWMTYSSVSQQQQKSKKVKRLKIGTTGGGVVAFIGAIINTYAFRTITYIVYGVGTIIAWTLNYCITGKIHSSISGITSMYSCYGTVVLCLLHFPEKYSLGYTDIFGASHQIFHCGVIAGVTVLWSTFMNDLNVQLK